MADPLRPSISKLGRPGAPGGVLGELQSEVSAEATPLLTFVLGHIRAIIAVIALIVAAAVAAGAWHWYSARAEREARVAFGRILVGEDGQERLSALEAFLASAPASLKNGVRLEIAATALRLGDPQAAATAYAAIHAADPEGALGVMAALNQADVLRGAGKPVEALAVLDALAASAPAELRQPMIQAIHEGQASAAEQAGRLDRALAAYEAIVKEGGTELGYYQAKITELKARLASSASPAASSGPAPNNAPAPGKDPAGASAAKS